MEAAAVATAVEPAATEAAATTVAAAATVAVDTGYDGTGSWFLN